LRLPSAAVEECVAGAVASTVAEWGADSGVVGWVGAFAEAPSVAVFGAGRLEVVVSVVLRLVPAFAAASVAAASGALQLAVFVAEQLAEVALAA
jgi:hypothetical protein